MTLIPTSLRSLGSSRLLQQLSWLTVAKVIQGVCGLLTTLLIARSLGPFTFGQLSLAIATVSIVMALATLGLEQIATREISISGTEVAPLMAVLYKLRIAGAFFGSAVIVVIASAPTLHPSATKASLLFVLSLLPLAQVGDVSEWRLIAEERSKLIATITTISAPTAVLVRLVLAIFGTSVEAFAYALVAEWAARSLLLTYASRKRDSDTVVNIGTEDFFRRSSSLLRESFPLLMAAIAVFIYMRIDQFMIGSVLGPKQVGLYSAAVMLAEAPLVIPVLLLRAALPRLTRESSNDHRERDRTLVKLMRSTFYLHLAGAAAVAVLAEPLIVFLYGESFRPAAAVLRIQAWGAPLVALGVISGAWIILQGRTSFAFWRTLAGAIVNIIFNLLFIPSFGIAGAATATLIAFATTAFFADLALAATRPLFHLKLQAIGFNSWKTQ